MNKELIIIEGDFKNERVSLQILNELVRIATLYIKRRKTQNEGYAKKVKKAGINFARIAFQAAQKCGWTTDGMEYENIAASLMKSAGFNELKSWLKSTEIEKTIIREMGERESAKLQNLWIFAPDAIEKIADFGSLRQEIDDHKAWLRFIYLALKNKSFKEEKLLMSNNSFTMEQKWGDKGKVFMYIVIAATLGTSIRPFSLNDLNEFSERISDFEKWQGEISDILMQFIPDQEVAKLFLSHSEMKKIISEFSEDKKRLPFLIAKRVRAKEEEERLKNLERLFERAIDKGVENERDIQLRSRKPETIVSRFNGRISALHPLVMHQIMVKFRYFIFWLEDKNLFRLLAVSAMQGDENLVDEITRLNAEKASEMKDFFNAKFKILDILRVLWDMPGGNTEHLRAMLEKHIPSSEADGGIKKETVMLEENEMEILVENIICKTILMAPVSALLGWLKTLNKFGLKVDGDFIEGKTLLALILLYDEAEFPSYIVELMEKKLDWFNVWRKKDMKEYFQTRVKRIVGSRLSNLEENFEEEGDKEIEEIEEEEN